jgi:hypothetical protein
MADSDSSIAWHRAQIKRLRETLLDLEAGAMAVGKIARSKKIGQARDGIAGVRRKLRQSEQIVEAHERRHARRPRGTDSRSLAGVRSA